MTVFEPKGDHFPLEDYLHLMGRNFMPDWIEIPFMLIGHNPNHRDGRIFHVHFYSGHKRWFTLKTMQEHCTLLE